MEWNDNPIIWLPKIIDDRGNLSFIEQENHIPFRIARAYWIYDVPGGEFRGSHAFRRQEEFIVALSGSFDVVLDDGKEVRKYSLNRSYQGVYAPRMTWRRMENFSTNSLCLVLASCPYDEEDYIRDYGEFVSLLAKKEEVSGRTQTVFSLSPEGSAEFPENSAELQEDSTRLQRVFRQISPLFDPLRTTVYDCSVFELPKVHDRRGNLTALNNGIDLPFAIKRVFYIYDIPSGAYRGAHAHKEAYQFIVAASSSFDVQLDDGHNKKLVHLDRPNFGLLVPPGVWCSLQNFSSAAVAMVLTSDKYDAADYIRDYSDFTHFKSCRS